MNKNRQTIATYDSIAARHHANGQYVPCLSRLRGSYASFTDTERRLADYLLAQPGKAMFYSIMEMAREGGVSVSTVTRFCIKLGFSGFVEMKIALAVELLNSKHDASTPIGHGDSTRAVVGKVFDLATQSLRDTLHTLDLDAVARASDAIAACRRVECFGHGNVTGPIAGMFQHRLIMIGVPAAAFTHDWQANSASLLMQGDVALGLSNSGTAIPVANALQLAREAGATTICITYAPSSPVARAADIVLLTATREPHEWSDSVASRLPMLTVLDTLYACVTLRRTRPAPT